MRTPLLKFSGRHSPDGLLLLGPHARLVKWGAGQILDERDSTTLIPFLLHQKHGVVPHKQQRTDLRDGLPEQAKRVKSGFCKLQSNFRKKTFPPEIKGCTMCIFGT